MGLTWPKPVRTPWPGPTLTPWTGPNATVKDSSLPLEITTSFPQRSRFLSIFTSLPTSLKLHRSKWGTAQWSRRGTSVKPQMMQGYRRDLVFPTYIHLINFICYRVSPELQYHSRPSCDVVFQPPRYDPSPLLRLWDLGFGVFSSIPLRKPKPIVLLWKNLALGFPPWFPLSGFRRSPLVLGLQFFSCFRSPETLNPVLLAREI